jgi:hypothetical protein
MQRKEKFELHQSIYLHDPKPRNNLCAECKACKKFSLMSVSSLTSLVTDVALINCEREIVAFTKLLNVS